MTGRAACQAPKPWVESRGDRPGARAGPPAVPSLLPALPSAPQLARAGTVGRQGAKLLLEVSERVRTLTEAYFSPERPLHLSFTHLVCRSAIEGTRRGPSVLPRTAGHYTLPAPRPFSPARVGLASLRSLELQGARGWCESRVAGGQRCRGLARHLDVCPGEQEQRMDLSHPVHADNCVLDPDTGECWREPPAYTFRDYRWVRVGGRAHEAHPRLPGPGCRPSAS